MGVNVRKALALAGMLVAAVAVVAWAQGAVPVWLRDWVRVVGALATLLGGGRLVQRWWPEALPGHPPRRADPALPRPAVRSARRTVIGIDLLLVLDLPVTILFVGFLPGWFQGDKASSPKDGPVWFQALTYVSGAVLFTGLLLALALQAVLLHRSVRRVAAGQEPRWLGTVLRNSPGALTLRAVRLGPGPGRSRLVRVSNTVKDFAVLDPGDEVVLDGSLRRWGWVAVSGFGRPRWVGVTWWQPRAAVAEPAPVEAARA